MLWLVITRFKQDICRMLLWCLSVWATLTVTICSSLAARICSLSLYCSVKFNCCIQYSALRVVVLLENKNPITIFQRVWAYPVLFLVIFSFFLSDCGIRTHDLTISVRDYYANATAKLIKLLPLLVTISSFSNFLLF